MAHLSVPEVVYIIKNYLDGALVPGAGRFPKQEADMKRALGLLLLALSLTGCAVRATYYPDPYWHYRHDWHRPYDR